MGNTVISGILFQPPKPHNALSYVESSESSDLTDKEWANNVAMARTLIKNERNNITATYLWLYSCGASTTTTSGGERRGVAAAAATSASKSNGNDDDIDVDGGGGSSSRSRTRYNLIPAIHITHNAAVGGGGGVRDDNVDVFDNNDASSSSSSSSSTNTSSAKYTLLYSHGNAEDLGLLVSFLCDLARLLQVNVLCYDYSGYGVSADAMYVYEFYSTYGREVREWQNWRCSAKRNDDDDVPIDYGRRRNFGGGGGGGIKVVAGNGRYCHFSREVFAAPMIHPPRAGESSSIPPDALRDMLMSRHSWTSPSPSETYCYANIHSAHCYLTKVANVPPERVILYGKSVGSGPTCWLAQRLCRATTSDVDDDDDINVGGVGMCSVADNVCDLVDSREPWEEEEGRRSSSSSGRGGGGGCDGTAAPGGVVLHSPFLSVIRVVLDVGFTTIGDLFPNVDRVGDFTCPVYIIHGSNDAIVPFYHGENLFQSLPDSTKTVPFWAQGAGHNNIEMDMPIAYIKRLLQFIRQCDRLNHPRRMSHQRALMQHQQLHHQQVRRDSLGSLKQSGRVEIRSPVAIARPSIARYASTDSYHEMTMPQSTNTQTAKGTGSIKPSKQRKQKGMLVIRSSHSQLPSPPPTSHLPFTTPNQHLSHQSSNDNVHSVVNNKLMMTMANQIGKAPSTQSMAIKQQQHLIVATSGKAEHHQQFYVPRNHNVQYDRSVSTGMLNTSFPLSRTEKHIAS